MLRTISSHCNARPQKVPLEKKGLTDSLLGRHGIASVTDPSSGGAGVTRAAKPHLSDFLDAVFNLASSASRQVLSE